MRINRLLGVIAILLLISAGSLCAQDIVKVKGVQGRWQVSEEITLKQAEERAFMEAKKAALQKAGVMENVWSVFGQILILVMIQIGGLGTIAIRILLATFLRRNITLKARNLLQESINSLQIGGIVRLIRQALKGTILFEAAGAFVMAFYFVPRLGWQRGIYYSIFHAISAFCNAGFDLMGYQGEYVSFVSAVDHPLINIPIMALIILALGLSSGWMCGDISFVSGSFSSIQSWC